MPHNTSTAPAAPAAPAGAKESIFSKATPSANTLKSIAIGVASGLGAAAGVEGVKYVANKIKPKTRNSTGGGGSGGGVGGR